MAGDRPLGRVTLVVAAIAVATAACSTGAATRSSVPTTAVAPPATATPTTATAATTSAATTTAATTTAPPTTAAPGTSAATTTTAAVTMTAAWPTYHRTADRAGDVTDAVRPTGLTRAWSAGVDGAVYGQPLVVGPDVIAATEDDSVYAFDLHSGALRWRTHLATPVARGDLPCGDIGPLGITGTPAFDPMTGSVFVVTESGSGSHDLVALNPSSGAVRWTRNLDVSGRDRIAEQQRAALAVANGRVYVAFGGLYGDCGNYIGYITATPAVGTGPTAVYAVPTAREGGMWAPPGPAVATDGSIYVAVGNGAATGGAYDGSDAVLHLSADLASRIDYFAPRAWAQQNGADEDLGSTGPLLLGGGLVVQSGKSGQVFLLDAARLGGVGAPVAAIAGCSGFGGMAADGDAVFVPCAEGLERVDVTATSLTARWRVTATGSPVVGGGAVWALDTVGGVLHAYDESSGAGLVSFGVGAVTRFTSPVLVPGFVIVGTQRGVTVLAVAG